MPGSTSSGSSDPVTRSSRCSETSRPVCRSGSAKRSGRRTSSRPCAWCRCVGRASRRREPLPSRHEPPRARGVRGRCGRRSVGARPGRERRARGRTRAIRTRALPVPNRRFRRGDRAGNPPADRLAGEHYALRPFFPGTRDGGARRAAPVARCVSFAKSSSAFDSFSRFLSIRSRVLPMLP